MAWSNNTPRERIRVSAEGFPVLDAVIRSRSVEGIRFDPLNPRDREACGTGEPNPPTAALGNRPSCGQPTETFIGMRKMGRARFTQVRWRIDLRAEGTGVNLTMKD
jgi:hypothetical protein